MKADISFLIPHLQDVLQESVENNQYIFHKYFTLYVPSAPLLYYAADHQIIKRLMEKKEEDDDKWNIHI